MCLTIKNFGMNIRLPRNKQFSTRTLGCDSVLEFSTDAMITPTMLLSNLFEFQYSVVQFLLVINDLTLAYQITPME